MPTLETIIARRALAAVRGGTQVSLTLPTPHDKQREILDHPARFRVVACGRKFGKTELAIIALAQRVASGQAVAYFAPTYKMGSDVWRALKRTLAPLITYKNETEHRIETRGGGIFECWSLDNADSVRPRSFHFIALDEAALIPNANTWTDILLPLLTVYKGGAIFLSTPRGHNWFWDLFRTGLDPLAADWQSWNYPTVANPYIDPAEVEIARQTMPERSYLQEYLADFQDDAGAVFRNIRACATAVPVDRAQPNRRYVIGGDLAKFHDWTVFAVMDIEARAIVHLDRFQQIDYTLQLGRLAALHDRFQTEQIIVERNVGEMFIEQAQRQGLPVTPFQTTHISKQQIIENLALAFERGDLSIIPDDVLIGELQAYAMERLPSGLLRYNAPSGLHDDTVIALALAWHGITSSILAMPILLG